MEGEGQAFGLAAASLVQLCAFPFPMKMATLCKHRFVCYTFAEETPVLPPLLCIYHASQPLNITNMSKKQP